MICPHCGKNTESVYIDGFARTREDAESELNSIIKRLGELSSRGAFSSYMEGNLEKQYRRLLRRAGQIEVALGL
jgi:hypothetical protein